MVLSVRRFCGSVSLLTVLRAALRDLQLDALECDRDQLWAEAASSRRSVRTTLTAGSWFTAVRSTHRQRCCALERSRRRCTMPQRTSSRRSSWPTWTRSELPILRVPGTGREPDLNERQLHGRRPLAQGARGAGRLSSPAGSRVWHVVGVQRSVREWAIRQGWGGRSVRQEQAQGILMGAWVCWPCATGRLSQARPGGLQLVLHEWSDVRSWTQSGTGWRFLPRCPGQAVGLRHRHPSSDRPFRQTPIEVACGPALLQSSVSAGPTGEGLGEEAATSRNRAAPRAAMDPQSEKS
jgi:hypothetical protein